MLLMAGLIKCATVALFVATTVAASQDQPYLETQGEVASFEQEWGSLAPTLPHSSYELALGLQQIAFVHNEDQAAKTFLSMFPGKVVLKKYRAPISGTMAKMEDMWELPFLYVEKGTPMFELNLNETSHVMVALNDVVVGRWLVESGAWVKKGDVIVEYYILANGYEETLFSSTLKQKGESHAAALLAEQAFEISPFRPPRDAYELSLSLQQLVFACGEYRAATVLFDMFPGKIVSKQLKAPAHGIVTKSEDSREPYMDGTPETVVFSVGLAGGPSKAATLPENAVIGRWFVRDGELVVKGDPVVDYYTIAADGDRSQALQNPDGVIVAKKK